MYDPLTLEHLVLRATAKNGVVKDPLLGRQVKLKAVVTKAGSASGKPELEILHCKAMKQAPAPSTIMLRFPPPATFGKHNIHKPGVARIAIQPAAQPAGKAS